MTRAGAHHELSPNHVAMCTTQVCIFLSRFRMFIKNQSNTSTVSIGKSTNTRTANDRSSARSPGRITPRTRPDHRNSMLVASVDIPCQRICDGPFYRLVPLFRLSFCSVCVCASVVRFHSIFLFQQHIAQIPVSPHSATAHRSNSFPAFAWPVILHPLG